MHSRLRELLAGLSRGVFSSRFEQLTLKCVDVLHRWQERTPTVSVWLCLHDAHSLLLVRFLKELVGIYDIRLEVRLLESILESEARPDEEQVEHQRRRDSAVLARALGMDFHDQPSSQIRSGLHAFLQTTQPVRFDETELQELAGRFESFWRGEADKLVPLIVDVKAQALTEARIRSRENLAALGDAGLFCSASLVFAADRYVGCERLHYLLARLASLGRVRSGRLRGHNELMDRLQCLRAPQARRPSTTRNLDVFFSFRSPYSYLALARLQPMIEGGQLDVTLRPVAPMVTRGVALSNAKRFYILRDASREARRRRIKFGRIVDPLHCTDALTAMLMQASSMKQSAKFAVLASQAIWAKGQDMGCARRLRNVALAAGFSEEQVGKADHSLAAASVLAEDNASALADLGHWGVPVLSEPGRAVWGQDRIELFLRQGNTQYE